MKTKNLTANAIVVSSDNFSANNAKVICKVRNERNTLNYIVKTISRDFWSDLAPVIAQTGLVCESAKDFNVKNVLGYISPKLTKDVDGTKTIAIYRRFYDTFDAQVYTTTADGKKLPVMRNGKPLTYKVVKRDDNGKRIVKETKLFAVNSWSISTLLTLLEQSRAIKTNTATAKILPVANEKKATKETAKIKTKATAEKRRKVAAAVA